MIHEVMDANDLKNGNNIYLVDIKNSSYRIIGTIENVKYSIGHSGIKCPVNELAMEPIEITDEILISNGFKKDNNSPNRYYFPKGTATYFLVCNFNVGEHFIGMDVGSVTDIRISQPLSFVHELQNAAYYIRGTELRFEKV
jgi:hypothetical protein